MANSIKGWLDGPQAVEQLVRWLRGYDLPWAWDNDEPYRCLMRGLNGLELAQEREGEFCNRVAAVLDQAVELAESGPRPEQVLYNVLMLAHCLHCPTCLGPSLYKLYDSRMVTGRWMGVDLQVALREALVENQTDQKLRGVWECMVREESDACALPGDALDGFRGILKMPSAEDATQPDVDAIVWAFSQMIYILDCQKDRIKKLYFLFEALVKVYPQTDWDIRAANRAEIDNWPRWARGVTAHLLSENELRTALVDVQRANTLNIARRKLLRGQVLAIVDLMLSELHGEAEAQILFKELKSRTEGNGEIDREQLRDFHTPLQNMLRRIESSHPHLTDGISFLIDIVDPEAQTFTARFIAV